MNVDTGRKEANDIWEFPAAWRLAVEQPTRRVEHQLPFCKVKEERTPSFPPLQTTLFFSHNTGQPFWAQGKEGCFSDKGKHLRSQRGSAVCMDMCPSRVPLRRRSPESSCEEGGDFLMPPLLCPFQKHVKASQRGYRKKSPWLSQLLGPLGPFSFPSLIHRKRGKKITYGRKAIQGDNFLCVGQGS